MTRRGKDDDPRGPGGHAGERRRQFEEERGLSDLRPLDLADEEGVEEDRDASASVDDDEPAVSENDERSD